MKIVYMSDDGWYQGTEADVRAYEEKKRDPLVKMGFPYSVDESGFIRAQNGDGVWGNATDAPERRAIIAFANLAPKIKAWRALKYDQGRSGWHPIVAALIDAYDEALELAKKL